LKTVVVPRVSHFEKLKAEALTKTTPITETLSGTKIRTIQLQAEKTTPAVATKTAVATLTTPMTAEKTMPLTAEKTITSVELIPPPSIIGGGGNILFPLLAFGSMNKLGGKKTRFVDGYDVFVRRKGKLNKLNIKPVDSKRALKQGVLATDKTTARTFVLKKTGKQVRSSGTKKPSLKKYRSPKGKSKLPAGSYVEKSKYAIDSPLERMGITMAGMKAIKLKVKKKPKKKGETRKWF